MNILKLSILIFTISLLPGCAAVPFGIGLIPGAPAYFSSIIGNGQTVYESAVDERTAQQQMLDSIIAGHAQAELYKNKDIRANQITTYAYFGKLYLVGEYDCQNQLRTIYECVDKVEGKTGIVSRLYLKQEKPEQDYLDEKLLQAEISAQLMADFEVTSTPVDVEVVQGDVILLGVISDKEERDKIMAHALNTKGVNRVISYLYHQENAGPEPRIMTAELAPTSRTSAPPLPRKRPSSDKTRPVAQKSQEPIHPIAAVTNPDSGR